MFFLQPIADAFRSPPRKPTVIPLTSRSKQRLLDRLLGSFLDAQNQLASTASYTRT